MRTFGPWVNCPYSPTTLPIYLLFISRFLSNFFPRMAPEFFGYTIHQVIWPSPGGADFEIIPTNNILPDHHLEPVSRLITFPNTSCLLLTWQTSPPGKVRGDAANPLMSRPQATHLWDPDSAIGVLGGDESLPFSACIAFSRLAPFHKILIRWPINRFNRFCDFLRFNRFNRFIEIIKSIFSKFWKLTNFRFLKKLQFSESFCYELNFVNCWLETTHWKRLESNSVHNEEMVPELTTRRRCRTLHHQIACILNQVSLGYIEHSFWWDHFLSPVGPQTTQNVTTEFYENRRLRAGCVQTQDGERQCG